MLVSVAVHSLQGALGKTAGRSYKAAPRQLLQVDEHSEESELVSQQAAHSAFEALGAVGGEVRSLTSNLPWL